jgi:hypothetical protein
LGILLKKKHQSSQPFGEEYSINLKDMALFKPSTWGVVKVYRDIENYRDWIRVIKSEAVNPNSKFNAWNLSHNFFYTLYFTHVIDETEAQLPERIMRLRMIEAMAPLHRYLDEELGFAGNLVPEFNQFYDEEGVPTLTYLVAYRFAFNKLSFYWVVKFLLKWAVVITAIALFFKNGGVEWLQGLI